MAVVLTTGRSRAKGGKAAPGKSQQDDGEQQRGETPHCARRMADPLGRGTNLPASQQLKISVIGPNQKRGAQTNQSECCRTRTSVLSSEWMNSWLEGREVKAHRQERPLGSNAFGAL
jgi:hypothetical protein